MNKSFLRLFLILLSVWLAPTLFAAPAFAQVHSSQCAECDPLADEAKRLQVIAEDANKAVDAALKAESDATKALRAAQKAYDDANRAEHDYIAQLRDKQRAAREKADADKAARLKQIAEIDAQIAKLQKQQQDLQAEYDQIDSRIEDATKRTSELADALPQLMQDVDAAQQAYDQARQNAINLGWSAGQVYSYTTQDVLDQQQQALKDAIAKKDEAKAALDEAKAALQKQKDDIQKGWAQVKALKNWKTVLKTKISDIGAEIERLKALRDRLSKIQDPVDNSGPEEDSQYMQLAQAVAAAWEAVQQAQANLSDAQASVAKAQAEAAKAWKAYNAAYEAWYQCMEDCRHGKKRKAGLDTGTNINVLPGGGGKTGGTDGGASGGGAGNGGTGGSGTGNSGGGTGGGGDESGYVPPDAPPIDESAAVPLHQTVCKPCQPYADALWLVEARLEMLQSEIDMARIMARTEAKEFDKELADLRSKLDDLHREKSELSKGYKAAKKAGIANDAGYNQRISAIDREIADTQAQYDRVDREYTNWEDDVDDYFDSLYWDYDWAEVAWHYAANELADCMKKCKAGEAIEPPSQHHSLVLPRDHYFQYSVTLEQVHLISGVNPYSPAEIRDIFSRF